MLLSAFTPVVYSMRFCRSNILSGLFSAILALSGTACTSNTTKVPLDKAPLPAADNGPASACSASGGKYLGDMRCQLANGSVVPVLAGDEAVAAMASVGAVAPGSPHSWALATTAIIFQANGDRHDLLAGGMVTADGQENGKRLLSRWWGVNNRDDLLKTLTWLQFEGHRSEFEVLGRQVDAMDEREFTTARAAIRADEQGLHRLDVVRRNHRRLGSKGILAWDLIRYISLCRWGHLSGYLSESEAWDLIMPAALRLQQTFTSWQDLQLDYLIGREYWSPDQTQGSGNRFQSIYDQLVNDSSSPWNVNPWAMNLGVTAALLITRN